MENDEKEMPTGTPIGASCTKREIVRMSPDVDAHIREAFPHGMAIAASTVCPAHGHGVVMLVDPKMCNPLPENVSLCMLMTVLEFNNLIGEDKLAHVRALHSFIKHMQKLKDSFRDEQDKPFEPPKPWSPEDDN